LRRTTALQPEGPFTPTVATRPGEIVQLDTTPLDVMAVLDEGHRGAIPKRHAWIAERGQATG
jgi:hypothetical protein